MRLLILYLLFLAVPASGELRFGDCVEIVGGIHDRPDIQDVEYVRGRRTREERVEYFLGDAALGIWVYENYLKKISVKICAERIPYGHIK